MLPRGSALWLSLFLIACGGVPPAPACHTLGESCDGVAQLCCSGLECGVTSTCVQPPSCSVAGSICASSKDCCGGLSCIAEQCQVPPTCGAPGTFCTAATAGKCCAGTTCPRYATSCQAGGVGDPCRGTADCSSGLTCNGSWCTRPCLGDDQCTAAHGVNDCVSNGSTFGCFPFCSSDGDCALYRGTSCKAATDVGGATVTVCSL